MKKMSCEYQSAAFWTFSDMNAFVESGMPFAVFWVDPWASHIVALTSASAICNWRQYLPEFFLLWLQFTRMDVINSCAWGEDYWGFAFQGLAYRCHQTMINALKSWRHFWAPYLLSIISRNGWQDDSAWINRLRFNAYSFRFKRARFRDEDTFVDFPWGALSADWIAGTREETQGRKGIFG